MRLVAEQVAFWAACITAAAVAAFATDSPLCGWGRVRRRSMR